MAVPATSAEFLNLVRQSGVLEEGRLAAYLQRQSGALPEEPKELAALLVRDGLVTRFQTEQFLRGKCRGFLIGQYKVLERIGAGGMALVYLCEHIGLRRRVAIKVLPTSFAKDEEYLKRFQREARAVAALEHPNIVRAYDLDRDNDLHFLVMEYVEGRALHEIVKRQGPLEPSLAADYARQAALGLQHAHEAGLVHRDIKPGNLMVDRAGTLKILDLGLARFQEEGGEVLTRGMLGTPDYLAPEQARDSHAVDIRADIYSLGCTLFYLLAGRPPFEGTPSQKIAFHLSNDPPPLLGMFRLDLPEELQAIVGKMMAKNRADRYRTPAEVAEALSPWARPSTVPSPTVDALTPSRLPPPGQETDPNLLTPLAASPPGSGQIKPVSGAKPSAPKPPPPLTAVPKSRTKPSPPPRPAPRRWLLFAFLALLLAVAVGGTILFLRHP